MTTKKETITLKALEIIKSFQNGIRYSELVNKIHQELSDIPMNTIHGTVWNLDVRLPKEIYKPARGLFRHTTFQELQPSKVESKVISAPSRVKEEDFYEPFADWLVNVLEDCTKAIPLGGNKFKDKWGTPDVVGIREPRKSDIIKPATEIVSAEIKIDSKDLITAFGQACSYKLFSHKSYIVIPKESSEEDTARLDGLCLIFGIGLILFNSADPENPEFDIRVRPIKQEPDMFYVNKYMKLIEDDLFS
jgi:hypothetical protein